MQARKRILILGGNGFVGGHLVEAACAAGFEIAVADMSEASAYEGVEYHRVDIGAEEEVRSVFRRCRPDLAVNVAAVADVDLAERDHALADRVNVEGARNGAAAAVEVGARYVWFSSDAVYDGIDRDFNEESPLAPVNYYGQTKRRGEEAVRSACPSAAILRLSLVLGFPLVSGNSFVAGLADKLARQVRVLCPVTEIRTPIDVRTLCSAVLELHRLGFAGVLNLGATSSIDRFELTKMLARGLGYDESLVRIQEAVDPSRAPRHANGILDISKARGILRETGLKNIERTVAEALRTARREERAST